MCVRVQVCVVIHIPYPSSSTSSSFSFTGCGEQGQLGRIPECFSARGGRRGIGMLLTPQIVRFRKTGKKRTLIRDIFCGAYHTFAVASDKREVYGWGLNNYHQLGTGDSVSKYQPHKLPEQWLPGGGGREVERVTITGGEHHTVMCVDGGVFVTGRKEYGRLGLGMNAEEPDRPRVVPGLVGVKTVASGGSCSFAVTNEGAAFSWGMGTNLQLGTGDEEDRWVPTIVTGKQLEGRKVIGVSAGGQHTALLVAKETE